MGSARRPVTTRPPTSGAFARGKGRRVAVRDLMRPLPGVRQLSLLRQRAAFRGSARYWGRNAGGRYVIIDATDGERRKTAPHVRPRHFSPWVEACRPDWKLAEVTQGPYPGPDRADFFTYERARPPDADPRWR